MKIAQLKAFVTVVEKGSFSEAARLLGVSQPSVTMQLQALEAELGVTLLDRRYRRIDLTEAGRALLPRARKVLAEIEQASDEVASLSGRVSGRLTVAASTTPGAYVVPFLLGSFVAKYPEVGVSVIVGDSSLVAESVATGQAQVGITGAEVRGVHVHYEPVGDDELVLIAPPDSKVLAREHLAIADLYDEPWVFREAGSGTRQITEELFLEHGLEPSELRILVELGTGEAIVSAVEGGLGLAIVSRMVADKALRLGTVAQVHAVGFPKRRPFFAVLPGGSGTRVGDAFADHLRDAMGPQRD